MTLGQLISLVHELPPEEHAALVEWFLQSPDPSGDADVEATWSEGIRRRLERLDSGQAQTIPWEEARRRIPAAAGRDPNA